MADKKQKGSQKAVEQVNQHILNIITPAGIDFDSNHANIGDNVGKVYAVTKYPTDGVDYGWMAPLCNMEGTATTVEFRYTDPAKITEVFNKKISELKADRELAKQESERQQIDQAVKDLQEMIHRISVINEPVGYVNTMLHIQDANHQSLGNRIKRVSSIAAVEGCNIRNLKYKQCFRHFKALPLMDGRILKWQISETGTCRFLLSSEGSRWQAAALTIRVVTIWEKREEIS